MDTDPKRTVYGLTGSEARLASRISSILPSSLTGFWKRENWLSKRSWKGVFSTMIHVTLADIVGYMTRPGNYCLISQRSRSSDTTGSKPIAAAAGVGSSPSTMT